MKFVLTFVFLMGFSVSFLYYLLFNQNFLPTISIHEVNWSNLFVFLVFSSVVVFSFLNIFLFFFYKLFQKSLTYSAKVRKSLKFSFLITLGILVAFLLHFFHLIDFIWGLGILIVLLLLFFVV